MRSESAFSLIEVVLSIGIVSFAFVGMFGLLPVGLSTFRQAIDNSVGSQIVQRLVNEAQQTDYPTLTDPSHSPSTRYFDDQGNEVNSDKDSIYTARISVTKTDDPEIKTQSALKTASLATVTIKLANNPAHKTISFDTPGNAAFATYTALIAKNQ
jgi:uncharacterized protein (TIGR02598 family)